MRACIQRVSEAQVTVEGEVTGKIAQGLVVLLGIGPADSEKELSWLAFARLRQRNNLIIRPRGRPRKTPVGDQLYCPFSPSLAFWF